VARRVDTESNPETMNATFLAIGLTSLLAIAIAYRAGRRESEEDRLSTLEFGFWFLASASLCASTAYYMALYPNSPGAVLKDTLYELIAAIVIAAAVVLYRLIFGHMPVAHLRMRLSRTHSPPPLMASEGKTNPAEPRTPLEQLTLLASESKTLCNRIFARAGVYLFIGVAIALGGLGFFWSFADRAPNGPTEREQFKSRLRETEELAMLRRELSEQEIALEQARLEMSRFRSDALSDPSNDLATFSMPGTPRHIAEFIARRRSEALEQEVRDLVRTEVAQIRETVSPSEVLAKERAEVLRKEVDAMKTSIAELEDDDSSLSTDTIIHYLRNFGMLLFVELLAFFFLRQYRSAMDDFRYFEAIQRRQSELIALLRLMESGGGINLDKLLAKNAFFSSAGTLSRGETTEWLEGRRLNNDELDIITRPAASAASFKDAKAG
jgi:hypothetical protein